MPPVRVVRHLWWDADRTRLVPTGDPAAAFLAYPAGTDIPEGDARRLGLVEAAAPTSEPAAKIRGGRPANKLGPVPANKSTTPPTSTEETP